MLDESRRRHHERMDEYPGRSVESDQEPEQLETFYVERGLRLADHWGIALTYGILLTGTGLVLALWPKQSLVLAAVLIAFALIVTGMTRVFLSMVPTTDAPVHGSTRTLVGVSGILAMVVGVLCLREPLQTVLLVGLMIGVWLLVAGFVDLISAALGVGAQGRLWGVFIGLVNVVAGGILVVHPHVSLGLLIIVVCVWLFSSGVSNIVNALRTRSRQRQEEHAPAT
jgi:uncharacterized membrane protein HdeD (DUF308 family)